jgi:hypothetical protein
MINSKIMKGITDARDCVTSGVRGSVLFTGVSPLDGSHANQAETGRFLLCVAEFYDAAVTKQMIGAANYGQQLDGAVAGVPTFPLPTSYALPFNRANLTYQERQAGQILEAKPRVAAFRLLLCRFRRCGRGQGSVGAPVAGE